ncbi:MAG: class I SAM-dependent methyltransferase [Deltaproteobacteria bacterium]|nr:class I SAM-dependent methyltransferase [Deltaproteobacteria bacterium]
MSNKNKVDSKEIGLDIALILANYFFKTEYLHYGYFTDDLKVEPGNISIAQENYANYILSKIPKETKTILDVGCGAGKFAEKLLDYGFEVDCVSPSPYLTKHAKKILGDRCHIHECGYEKVETTKKYDLVLFSESFQYIPLAEIMRQTPRFLKPRGHMLICDFFRKDVEGRSPIGGGHDLKNFYDIMSKSPFQLLIDEDITKETAPSMDIVNGFLTDVLHPVWDLIFYVLDHNYAWLSKILRWKFSHKIEKVTYKYFQNKSNGENFAFFKSYHFLLYQLK